MTPTAVTPTAVTVEDEAQRVEPVAYVEVDGRRVPVYARRALADVALRAVIDGRRALGSLQKQVCP